MKKILVFSIAFVMQLTYVFAFYDFIDEDKFENEITIETSKSITSKPVIQATAAILFDRTSKRILFEKNKNKKVPNASTTKILTAIVAIENGNLDDIVTISSKAAGTGGSKVDLRAGDMVSLKDLIYGLLLRSGNDAAVAISEYIGGDIENFCKMMNEKAKQIGAFDTNFTSPHGLDDEEHYSTAYDLAIIADYALNIPEISYIVSKKNTSIKINDYFREINNTNEMLAYYTGADGIKTGYTGNAGRCLVTSATRNGWQLISVVLGCNTKKQRTIESTALLNFGFNNYQLTNICEKIDKNIEVYVKKSKENVYKCVATAEYWYPLTKSEITNINYIYDINENLVAPLRNDTIVGNIYINVGNSNIFSAEIKPEWNIERKEVIDFCADIIKMLPQNSL